MQQATEPREYYFVQAGIERSRRFATQKEALDYAGLFNQTARCSRGTIRKGVEGKRGSVVVQEWTANCVKRK